MTFSGKRRIEIYARPGDDALQLAFDIAHELGHAIDLSLNDSQSRKRWLEARGIKAGTPWFGCNRCSDYSTPAGDFAETFAFLVLGPGHFGSRMAPPPKPAQKEQLMSFFTKGSTPKGPTPKVEPVAKADPGATAEPLAKPEPLAQPEPVTKTD
jgi:hypothetical protein